jgi:hypothetical protein
LVETVYLMIAAESGWPSLVVFILWLLIMYTRNIINIFTYGKTEYRYLTIGLAGGLLGIYLESALEWVLKQTNNFYQLMLVFGVIAAMRDKTLLQKKKRTKCLQNPT